MQIQKDTYSHTYAVITYHVILCVAYPALHVQEVPSLVGIEFEGQALADTHDPFQD